MPDKSISVNVAKFQQYRSVFDQFTQIFTRKVHARLLFGAENKAGLAGMV